MLLFTTYTSMLTFPMRQLGRILADLGKADISLSRLEDILAVPAEAEPGKALTPQIDGSVAFEDVCFDYGGRRARAFPCFSSPYGPARPLASSAARARAESSLVQLLQRLYPVTAGRITLSGVDVNDIERHHLRRNVGLVSAGAVPVQPHHRRKHRHRPAATRIVRTCMPRAPHGLGT